MFISPPDAPKLPSVSVSPSAEIVEGSSVTLTGSSDANPAATCTWYKSNGDGVTYSSTEICALKGSTVDISCSYRYPSSVKRAENRFWFRTVQNENYVDLKNEARYLSCVQYNCGNNDCTLRITDLRESDSAEQMKHTLSFVEHYLFKLRNGKKRVSIPLLKMYISFHSEWWNWYSTKSLLRLKSLPTVLLFLLLAFNPSLLFSNIYW